MSSGRTREAPLKLHSAHGTHDSRLNLDAPPTVLVDRLVRDYEDLTARAVALLESRERRISSRYLEGTGALELLTPQEGDALVAEMREDRRRQERAASGTGRGSA